MAETNQPPADTAVAVTPAATPKKAKKAAAKKPTHPKTSDMVNSAIKDLKERGGSSLQAIKKYIAANYKIDAEKLAPFIRKYLKAAVASGALLQTKGKGASGSFKLAVASKDTSRTAAKKPKAKRAAASSVPTKKPAKKSPAAKTVAAKKKAATPKKKPAAVVAKSKTPTKKVAVKASTPSKTKKSAKGPTKKPKTPKPKKVIATKAVKKTSPRRK